MPGGVAAGRVRKSWRSGGPPPPRGPVPGHNVVGMETVGMVLVLAGFVVLAAAVVALLRLRREVGTVEARARRVAERMDALPPELTGRFGAGDRHVIVVELLNLFDLAHRESALTRPFTALTPRLVRDLVHRGLVGKVRESLTAAGVEADVRVRRAR